MKPNLNLDMFQKKDSRLDFEVTLLFQANTILHLLKSGSVNPLNVTRLSFY